MTRTTTRPATSWRSTTMGRGHASLTRSKRGRGAAPRARRRSTRTSRTSSTAVASSPTRARTGSSWARAATSPPTTSPPRCRRRKLPLRLAERLAGGLRVRRGQPREPRHGRAFGRSARRDPGRRGFRRGARRDPRGRRACGRRGARDCGSRQRGADARARRLAAHRPHDEPRTADLHARRGPSAGRRQAGRSRAHGARACSASRRRPR